jgi:prophage regulatory protein
MSLSDSKSAANDVRRPASDSYLRTHQVIARTGLSRVTLWRLEQRGGFPARRKLTERSVGWLQSEVEAWINSRSAVATD